VVLSGMANYEKCKLQLENFIQNFKSKSLRENIFNPKFLNSSKKYFNQCKEMIKRQRTKFIFELEDLISTSHVELKDLAFFNTQRFLEILVFNLKKIFSDYSHKLSENIDNTSSKIFYKKHLIERNDLKNTKTLDFQVILVPPKAFPIEKIGLFDASMIGKFIMFNGTCLTFSVKITRLNFATYFCKVCNSKISSKINNPVFKPILYCFSKVCEKKFNRRLFLDLNLCKFQTFERIKCCQLKENNNFENSEIEVYFNEQSCESFYPGKDVRCAGVLLPIAYEWVSTINNSVGFFFQASFIERFDYDFYDERLFLNKQKFILELIRSPNLYDRISDSLLPFFFGNSDLKKSLTLAITSCNSTLRKKSLAIRQQIHILLIGDYNIGKTSILRTLSEMSQKGKYVNPLWNPSKISFDSQLNKENEKFSKKKPRVKLSEGGIIFLENVFFLEDKEFFELDDVLDNQLFLFDKMNPNITIIASVAKFEPFEIQKTLTKTSHVKTEFFHKFDLVFFKDYENSDSDNSKISNYLLENYGKEKNSKRNNVFIENILKAFFKESEHINPKFTKTSIEMAIYHYVIVKGNENEKLVPKVNIRFLASIIRISMALARLNFKNSISINDTKEASRLITSSILSMKNFKLTNLEFSSISNENKIYNLIRKTSLRLKKPILSLLYLSKLSFSMGFSGEDFARCLEVYENLNVWAISLKQMKLVFLV